MSMLGKSLSEAKGNVDSLLDGEKVIIEVDDMDLAQEFLMKLREWELIVS